MIWRADTKQVPETHRLRDKRKGQHCLFLLISNKQHTFSSQGRPEISIPGKNEEGATDWAGEWRKTGLYQNNISSPRTSPIYNHKTTPSQPQRNLWTTTEQPVGAAGLIGLEREAVSSSFLPHRHILTYLCLKKEMKGTDLRAQLMKA